MSHAHVMVPGGTPGAAWTAEQQVAFLEDGARRTRAVLDMLANTCPSLSIRRRVCGRLVKEGIIDESWRLAETMIREESEELLEVDASLGSLDDLGDLALDEDPQGDDDVIDPVDLLQIEVFTASAVKNIGRFNCEFVKGERLGRGAFGTAWRCHHLVDEQDYCVKELHLTASKFHGSARRMVAYARSILREVSALSHCESHANVVKYNAAWAELVTERSLSGPGEGDADTHTFGDDEEDEDASASTTPTEDAPRGASAGQRGSTRSPGKSASRCTSAAPVRGAPAPAGCSPVPSPVHARRPHAAASAAAQDTAGSDRASRDRESSWSSAFSSESEGAEDAEGAEGDAARAQARERWGSGESPECGESAVEAILARGLRQRRDAAGDRASPSRIVSPGRRVSPGSASPSSVSSAHASPTAAAARVRRGDGADYALAPTVDPAKAFKSVILRVLLVRSGGRPRPAPGRRPGPSLPPSFSLSLSLSLILSLSTHPHAPTQPPTHPRVRTRTHPTTYAPHPTPNTQHLKPSTGRHTLHPTPYAVRPTLNPTPETAPRVYTGRC